MDDNTLGLDALSADIGNTEDSIAIDAIQKLPQSLTIYILDPLLAPAQTPTHTITKEGCFICDYGQRVAFSNTDNLFLCSTSTRKAFSGLEEALDLVLKKGDQLTLALKGNSALQKRLTILSEDIAKKHPEKKISISNMKLQDLPNCLTVQLKR